MGAKTIDGQGIAPIWWAPLYAERQGRLLAILRRRLRRMDDGGAQAAKYFLEGLARFERPEIDAAVESLYAEGALRIERRYRRDRHGTRVLETWYAAGGTS